MHVTISIIIEKNEVELDFIFAILCAITPSVIDPASNRPFASLEPEMTSKRSSPAAPQKPLQVMPIRRLGLAELGIVEQALADVASHWSVELDGVSVENTSLVVLPDSGDDAMGPSFVISRESLGFRLDQLHWDLMQEIGTFAILADAIAAIRVRLLSNPAPTCLMSLTLH